MKETQIAKENVKLKKGWGVIKNEKFDLDTQRCLTHLQSCKRFLEFLEKKVVLDLANDELQDAFQSVQIGDMNGLEAFESVMLFQNKNSVKKSKIIDLQNAIKTYEENGI